MTRTPDSSAAFDSGADWLPVCARGRAPYPSASAHRPQSRPWPHLAVRGARGQVPLGRARPRERPHGAAVAGQHVRESARGRVAQAHGGVLRACRHLRRARR
jgi:hypothetical protein